VDRKKDDTKVIEIRISKITAWAAVVGIAVILFANVFTIASAVGVAAEVRENHEKRIVHIEDEDLPSINARIDKYVEKETKIQMQMTEIIVNIKTMMHAQGLQYQTVSMKGRL